MDQCSDRRNEVSNAQPAQTGKTRPNTEQDGQGKPGTNPVWYDLTYGQTPVLMEKL